MADSNRKGAFELANLRQRSLDGFWETASTNAQYGWLGGGLTPTTISFVDRIDLSNDTGSSINRSILTVARTSIASMNNANYAWWATGNTAGATGTSVIDRTIFSSDTTTAVARGQSVSVRVAAVGVGNNNFGWVGGGIVDTIPAVVSTVNRITYANDTAVAGVRGALSVGRVNASSISTQNFGWVSNGNNPAPNIFSSVDRIDFSNDISTASVRNPLPSPRYVVTAVNNDNYGWVAGGLNPGSARLSSVERLDISNDLAAGLSRGPRSSIMNGAAGLSNSNYGWFAGGYGTPPIVITSFVERIDFSNDTSIMSIRGALRATLSNSSGASGIAGYPQILGAVSGAANITVNGFGWVGGGKLTAGTVFSTVDRIDFSNDLVASPARSPLTSGRYRGAAASNSNYGWFAAGTNSPGGAASTVDRINFANDSVSPVQRGPLTAARGYISATGNASYGWFVGGNPGPTYTIVERIDYSNDNALASSRGVLSLARYMSGTTSNSIFGWIGGGSVPSTVSTVDRIEFSNDGIVALARGPLTIAKWILTGNGNLNYGWFSGGNANSVIDRIDYSNDSATAAARTFLSAQFSGQAPAGNANYGWFVAGSFGGQSSIVNRLDYSNDTTVASSRGPVTSARYFLSGGSTYVKERQQPLYGTENGTYGWINHGSPAAYSRIERIDFANDTAATSKQGVTALLKGKPAATSNNSFGWFSAGAAGALPTSYIERLDLYNDLLVIMPRSTTTIAKMVPTGAGNANYGWIAGGSDVIFPRTVIYSTVERMTYASDTITPVVRGSLSIPRANSAATSNANYGWVGSGNQSITISPTYTVQSVDRIDFANDLSVASVRGVLNQAVEGQGATGNNNFGWFVGGYRPIPGPTSQNVTTVNRIEYANDGVTATTRGQMPVALTGWAATSNNNYGWFIRDITSYRIDFANDTTLAAARGTLTGSRYGASAVSNYVKDYPINIITQYNIGTATAGTSGIGTYGWFAGGNPGPVSLVDRLDFTNDTVGASARGTLSVVRYSLTATGNANFGWFISGIAPATGFNSVIDRIDYANDSVAASVRGALAAGRYAPTATGNANYGWATGGNVPGPVLLSRVERIDYSADLVAATTRGPLTAIRSRIAATSTPSFGFFSGGYSTAGGPSVTVIDRIDFSNDSATALLRAQSSIARQQQAATGNTRYGFFAGGYTPSGPITNVDRLDFTNDTAATLARGPITVARQRHAGSGNINYGWFGAGLALGGSQLNSVDRIDYSNDTATGLNRGSLIPTARNQLAATSNFVR